MWFRGGYRSQTNRLLGNVTFFMSATVAGAIVGAYAAGEAFGAWISQAWILLPMTIASGIAGAIGWWMGEKIVRQLQRAGKLNV